jgi:hypothetical protein
MSNGGTEGWDLTATLHTMYGIWIPDWRYSSSNTGYVLVKLILSLVTDVHFLRRYVVSAFDTNNTFEHRT